MYNIKLHALDLTETKQVDARGGLLRGTNLRIGRTCLDGLRSRETGVLDSRREALESLVVDEELGLLFSGLVLRDLIGGGRTVEVAAPKDSGVHGDGLPRTAVVRGQLLEGRGVGEDAGSLLGFLLGLDLGRGSAVEVVPAEDLGGYLDGSRAGVVRGELP